MAQNPCYGQDQNINFNNQNHCPQGEALWSTRTLQSNDCSPALKIN